MGPRAVAALARVPLPQHTTSWIPQLTLKVNKAPRICSFADGSIARGSFRSPAAYRGIFRTRVSRHLLSVEGSLIIDGPVHRIIDSLYILTTSPGILMLLM